MSYNSPENIPAEQPKAQATANRPVSIGLPASSSATERRFPITPEAANILTERGYTIIMESKASAPIHYSDNRYSRSGVKVAGRAEALGCDIVIHLAPLSSQDVKKMRRGAMLLTLFDSKNYSGNVLQNLLERGITAIAIDYIKDSNGNMPFLDMLSEINGRAAIAIASSLLANPVYGKGILIGGIAGVAPCEVTIIGSDIAACAAARSALGLGATVRMFDNDTYRMRSAIKESGNSIIGSAIYPHVLENALRSADVVITTEYNQRNVVDSGIVDIMKRRAIAFDLCTNDGKAFPSLPTVNLAEAINSGPTTTASRVCYINVGNAVPRTAAMALSNTFLSMFDNIESCDGITNALKIQPGMRPAVFTFMGKVVNARIASESGLRYSDINIYLSLS